MQDKESSARRQLMSGVAIMTLSTAIVKIIGLVYKIPMLQLLSEEGMAYFNAAYNIYVMFYMISTAGLPVAISILVSENRVHGNTKNIKKIYRVALSLFFVIGLAGTLCMLLLSKQFAGAIDMDRSVWCIVAIAPTLFFVCLSSAVRGYFQGHQIMAHTGISQIIEALAKMVIGLLFAAWALKKGYDLPIVAAFGVLGLTVGVVLSALYLVLAKIVFEAKHKSTNELCTPYTDTAKKIFLRLVKIAIPITLSSSVMGVTRIVDTALIASRLQDIGFSVELSTRMYGAYSTLAVPMYNLPPAIISGISLSVVPMLTSSIEARNRDKEKMVISSSLRVCALFAMPCAVGISMFSRPILELLFAGQTWAIDTAAPLLSVLGIAVLFASMMTVTNAILQAYGQERKPIISMALGCAVNILFKYLLIGSKTFNIYGAPLSTLLCTATVMILNFCFIKKYAAGFDGVIKLLYRPMAAAVVSVGGAFGVYMILRTKLGISNLYSLVGIAVAALLYVVLALVFRAVEEEDIKILPKGEKLLVLFRKLKLIK